MGSAGSIYDPVGNSLDCGERAEIMGGNGMQRGVGNGTDQTREHPG